MTTTQSQMTENLLAVVDPDAPARVRKPRRKPASAIQPDITVFRVPDYYDETGDFAVFIGDEATVLVEAKALPTIDQRLTRGSIQARTGHFPTEEGIVVQPHTGRLESPVYGSKYHEAQVAWAHVHHVLVLS